MSWGDSSAGMTGAPAAAWLTFEPTVEPAVAPMVEPRPPGSEQRSWLSPGIEGSVVGAVERPSALDPGARFERVAPASGVVGCTSVLRPMIASTPSPRGTLGGVALA